MHALRSNRGRVGLVAMLPPLWSIPEPSECEAKYEVRDAFLYVYSRHTGSTEGLG